MCGRFTLVSIFSNVLVGVDGRQGGRDAIALARLLADPDASFTFAHVYGGQIAAGRVAALAEPLYLDSSERLLAAERRVADVRAETISLHGHSVGRALHEFAEHRGCDLLVVGSCHRGMLGRTFLGDDARAAVNGAPCAVAIAPRGYLRGARFSAIGVGCDVSPEAAQALRAARELASRHDAAVKALAVVSLPPYDEPVPEQWPKVAGQLVVEELHRLDELEGVEGDATYGVPREELAAFSAGMDLLIIGSRSYGPVGRLFRGSTSNYLERHSRCPLLVLPRSAGPAGESATPAEQRSVDTVAATR